MILKLFRALSEEAEGCVKQGDSERSFNMKKNDDRGCEKALKYKRSSPSYVLLPPGGEEISCDSEEAENDTNMTDEERDLLNRWDENTEDGFRRERELSMENERQNASDDCEAQQVACQHPSDCGLSGCGCAAVLKQDDDGGEAKQRLRQELEHSDVTFEASKTSSCSAESLIALAQPGPEAGEQKQTPEQSAELFCLGNTNEERSGAEEESSNKEINVFPDHSFSSKDMSLNICITPSDMARNPPPGTTISRATYFPGSPTEKHLQLPALFSGLRVLRKGVLGPEHDIVAQIRPSSQGSDMEDLPEKEEDARGSILEQISNFLSQEKRGIEKEEEGLEEDGESREMQTKEAAEAASEPVKPVSSAEAAFDAFKAFFTPKPLKKDPGDKADLEAVRKRIKAERDALRALFEGSSVKSSDQKESSDQQVGTTSYGTQHILTEKKSKITLFAIKFKTENLN